MADADQAAADDGDVVVAVHRLLSLAVALADQQPVEPVERGRAAISAATVTAITQADTDVTSGSMLSWM